MKDTDKRRLEKLVKYWAPRMGLHEWEISVMPDEPTVRDGRVAETEWDTSCRVAHMRFDPNVVGRSDEEHTVLHELGHLCEGARRLNNMLPEAAHDQRNAFEAMLDDQARYLLKSKHASSVAR